MVWFFQIFPLWIGLIVAINLWDDHAKGKPLDWTNIWAGLGFAAFTFVLFVSSKLIYKFVCRYAQFRDDRP